jgi:hypothetical protein
MPNILFVLREYCPGNRHTLQLKGQAGVARGDEPSCEMCGGTGVGYMRERNFGSDEELLAYVQDIPSWKPYSFEKLT